ncbi:MAG: hypothetical protein R3Y07_10880 [Eubacteriales bacterium]
MEITRYINQIKTEGELPEVQIQNPTTVAIITQIYTQTQAPTPEEERS